MSGLLMRSVWTAGQDGFRDASSKQPHDLSWANGSHGLSRTLDRSILPSAPLAAPLSRTSRSADLSGGGRRCTEHPRAVVTLTGHHQLPGDTGNLVGECHGREFCRLALQQGQQPGRWMTTTLLRLLDHGGCSPGRKCRPEGNARGSGVFITSPVAPIAPTPGISASRRLSALARCQARSLISIAFNSTCNCTYSRPWTANSSRASAGTHSSCATRANSGSILSSPLASVTPNSAA